MNRRQLASVPVNLAVPDELRAAAPETIQKLRMYMSDAVNLLKKYPTRDPVELLTEHGYDVMRTPTGTIKFFVPSRIDPRLSAWVELERVPK